ncbi:MAG: cytochrome c [Alphaproteobacteria bacterium]|nr:cytochrome c [Alphaproteobacteria bacterium]
MFMVTLLMAATVAAQDPSAIVKERQDLMGKLWPSYFSSFNQVARGQNADIASVAPKAQEATAAVRKFGQLFPDGSGREAVPGTRAKPEVWTKRAEFDAAVALLAAETEKLGQVARTGDLEAFKTQFAATSRACGGCHGGPSKSGGTFRFEAQ